jgi:hypothetical protein
MRWSRVALYSLYCVLAVVGIVLVLAFTIDLGRFKEPATALVSDLLQRELEIAGPLHINIGRKVEIYAEDARLASADWAADPDMASLRRLEATVDTWSLIRWPIMVESLTIDGGRLNLELSEERGHSWRFFEGREKIPDDEQAEKKPKKRFRLPVLADDIRLTDTVFTLDSPGRPEPLRISATEINEDLLETDEVQVTLDGDINDTPVALLVTAGGLDNLVEFLDVEFGLNGNLGEITFEGEATFADLLSPIRPVGTVTLVGPSIEYLTDTLELPRITTGPLQLSAEIAPVNDNMQLQLDGTFGEFSLLSDGRFVSLRELQEIDLRVSASGPDAGTIARLLGNEDVPRDPFNVMGVLQRSGSRITVEDITVTIGETQFGVKAHFADFPRPQGANATVRINGPDIGRFTRLFGLPGRLDGPFKMEADLVPLAAGGATVDVSVTARDGGLTVGGNLTQEHDLSGTEILVRYRGANLRTITDALNIADAPAEPFDLMARLARVSDGIRLDGGSLTLADDILTFSGMIGNKPLEADTDVTFELVGPNLAELLVDFGRDADELPYAPYRASGRVSTAPGQFLLHDILLAFGESLEYQLSADGHVTNQPQLLGTRIRAGAKGASLRAITDAAGIEGIPNVAFDASATVELKPEGFGIEDGRAQLGDDNVTVNGLVGRKPLEKDTDLEFGLSAPDLKATLASFGIEVEQLPAGPLRAGGEIRSRGDYFSLRGVTASLAGANAELSGRLGALPDLDGTDIEVRVHGEDLKRLLPDSEYLQAFDKPFRLDSTLRLKDGAAEIPKLEFAIDQTLVSAEGEFQLEPRLERGQLKVIATSPDLFVLSPRLAEIAVPEEAPMDLQLAVHWADTLWTVDRLSLKLGRGSLETSGTIDKPPSFERTDLAFDWNVSSLNNFSHVVGRELPDQPAHLTFRLVGSEDSITLDHFSGMIAGSDLTGDFTLRYGDVPDVDISLTSSRLNLKPFLPPLEVRTDEPEPVPAAPKDKDRKVIPDTPVPLNVLQTFLADVDVRVTEIVLRERSLLDFVLSGSVADGSLALREFNVRNDRGGELSGRLGARPLDGSAEIGMRISGSGLQLGLPALSRDEASALPAFDADLAFISSGATVRELAGNVNGYLRIVSGEGKVRANALRILTQDFMYQLLNTINPFTTTDPYTNLKCVTVLATVEDGQVRGKPVLVMQSDKLNVFANANVDLKTEKLGAEFNTVPQKGLGISLSNLVNPYVAVVGTLGNPGIALDPESVLIEGGVAVATAGISILAKSFKDRFLSSRDPCGKAIKDADEAFQALREKYGRSGDVEQE